jgi:hypothetical protein
MDLSVGWTTEESGFDNRRGHVFIISKRTDRHRGPPYLRVPRAKRWVVNLMCATFKNARSCTSFIQFVVVRNEVLVNGQHCFTSNTKYVIVECHLQKWRPVLASSVSFYATLCLIFGSWTVSFHIRKHTTVVSLSFSGHSSCHLVGHCG